MPCFVYSLLFEGKYVNHIETHALGNYTVVYVLSLRRILQFLRRNIGRISNKNRVD